MSNETFYQRLDRIEQENRLKRLFNNRPENLHDYQGCANDPSMQKAAESLPAQPETTFLPPLGDRSLHFEDKDVVSAMVGSDYLIGKVKERLMFMTTGEKWSLYRAIVKLAAAPVAEPKPTPSGITEDQKRMVNRALDQLDAILIQSELVDLEGKCQELFQDWETGTAGFTNDEMEMAEIGFRGGFKAALKLKPQPDSSSIPDEAFKEWWHSKGRLFVAAEEIHTQIAIGGLCERAWAASKGQSNGR